MSTDLFSRYGHLLKADGTNQLQRTLPALEQGYIRPDERTLSELVEYARALAAEVRFYNLSGQAVGDWRPFLEPLLADPAGDLALPPEELSRLMGTRRDWPPHVALFLVFLELFGHLQDDLNELPERHLAHYYEQVLQLTRRPAEADDVHVIFELARNAPPTLLAAGTALDAGKDGEKRPLIYKTRSEVVVSAAEVSDVHRLVRETESHGGVRFFVSDAIDAGEGPAWYTFGRRQLDLGADQRFMIDAEVGFAIASPQLSMAEGDRSLSITARVLATRGLPTALAIGQALQTTLTGEEGWVAPDSFQASLTPIDAESLTLQLDLTLGPAAPAIVPFDGELHGPGPASEWPVMRVLLDPASGRYETFRGLILQETTLRVEVEGVRDLLVHNDQGPLSADGPMQLFGGQPRLGSRFYVGSAEVFSSKLETLAINLEWQDPPEDFEEYYRAYFDSEEPPENLVNDFQVAVDLLYERSWDHRLLSRQLLFGLEPLEQAIEADPTAFVDAFPDGGYAALPELVELEPYRNGSKHGFLRLELTGASIGPPEATLAPFNAFGHQAFSRRYASQAIALSRYDPTSGDPEPELPNEPYTPTLAGLSLDYTAEYTMVPGDKHAEEEVFVVHPWGYAAVGEQVAAHLVPELDPLVVQGTEPLTAALLLGVEKLEPPATLSLLFQIDRGTAASTDVLEPGEVEWSYLSGDRWQAFTPESVFNDSTYGFQQPGLIVLAVDRDASTRHTVMPSDKVWLQALIRRPPESASRTLQLSAQAAMAEFEPSVGELDDYAEHLQAGLPAGSVTRLQKRVAAVKKVSQPYASFEGRAAEEAAAFFRRSSERLRHRSRSVTAWDFERLVLEAFPEVFKVKCLPHSDAEGNTKAGEVALVIVPDLRSSAGTNLLEPRAGAVLMGKIEDAVAAGLSTSCAAVHVVHPVFERIRVDARVAFQSGLDAGYYARQLDIELQRFLSPWAFEEGQDIVFGARIYRSEVLAFMEERDYVDFVTDFDLYHSHDGPARGGVGTMTIGIDFLIDPDPSPAIPEMSIGTDFVVGRGVEVAETTRSHAILVSHPEHRLTAIDPSDPDDVACTGIERLGIGFMTVGLDFEVHPG